ncbi:hypothetical protein ABIC60_002226 [Phyllobacterium ifriqiyense]
MTEFFRLLPSRIVSPMGAVAGFAGGVGSIYTI